MKPHASPTADPDFISYVLALIGQLHLIRGPLGHLEVRQPDKLGLDERIVWGRGGFGLGRFVGVAVRGREIGVDRGRFAFLWLLHRWRRLSGRFSVVVATCRGHQRQRNSHRRHTN